MKVICFVLCFVLIVFPLATCQSTPAAEASEMLPGDAGGFEESREFDLENAEIFIESQGQQLSGSIKDISVDTMLSIELDEAGKPVKVIIMSDTNEVFGNMPFEGGKRKNGVDAQ